MKKAARLIALLILLKRHRGLHALDIAQRMGTTERTVYRDIALLNEGLGDYVQIISTPDGYSLDETIQTPPLQLIAEELEALQTSVSAMQKNNPHYQLAHQALIKLESQAGSFLNLTDLENRLAIMQPSAKDRVPLKKLQEIDRALQSKQVLEIEYFSHHSRLVKTIHFEPYSLLFRKQAWYVLGRDSDRDKILLLRAYRIRTIQARSQTFRLPSGFSVKAYFQQHWEVFDGTPQSIRLRFIGPAALLVEEMIWHPSQHIEHLPDGSIELSLNVAASPEFMTWILGWGSNCLVIEPKELQTKIRAQIQSLRLSYENLITKEVLSPVETTVQ